MTRSADLAGVTMRWATRSHIGRVRAQNQDEVFAAPGLYVVADGMGGHSDGAAAAAAVVKALAELAPQIPATRSALRAAVRNAEIAVEGLACTQSREPGSTVTVLVLADDGGPVPVWVTANVGDSRTYRWVGGILTQVTKDHSHVQELLDAHLIDTETARRHPGRNILTRALGAGPGAPATPDVQTFPVDEARFLLCSDGLTAEVTDHQIQQVLAAGTDPAQAADTLVDLALSAGARDNVTVVVVDVAPRRPSGTHSPQSNGE